MVIDQQHAPSPASPFQAHPVLETNLRFRLILYWKTLPRRCVLRVCYAGGTATSTSSFRISDKLRLRLEDAARRMNKGKNWIINRALDEYLERHNRAGLREEARRQSLLASRKRWKDDALWEKAAAEVWND